jgi:hypothetical protein
MGFLTYKQQLKRIGRTIATLNKGCEEMRRHITAAHQETAPVLEEASDLLTRKQEVETKQALLEAFATHFVMSNDDLATLTSTAEPVDDRFFAVLNRAKQIQGDTSVLLGSENQRLGLEIMEQVTNNMNAAYQKLYRWVQREFKGLNLENPQISGAIRRALKVLAERPSLFQSCLDFFAEAREGMLSDAFYTALTGMRPNGEQDRTVKPLEMSAHDPLRYVGDMLAWAHSAVVSEREALEVLFISEGDDIAKGIQAGRENDPWNRYGKEAEEAEEPFDGSKALNQLVDRDVSMVLKVLKQRVEQVIHSYDEAVLIYKLANLISFYRLTIAKVVAADSQMLETLQALENSALRQFTILTRDHIAGLQVDAQQVPKDLSPPLFLSEALTTLKEILKTYDTSLTPPEQRGEVFAAILREALDPYLTAVTGVNGVGGMRESLSEPELSVFTINCLSAAEHTLQPYDFCSAKTSELREKISEYEEELREYQYQFLLQTSGVSKLIDALFPPGLEGGASAEKVIDLPEFQPERLRETSQTLDDFLPSALMDALDTLQRLQDSSLARKITEKAADQFCEDFERVEVKLIMADEVIDEPEGRDREDVDSDEEEPVGLLRQAFPRTTGEIRVLLS